MDNLAGGPTMSSGQEDDDDEVNDGRCKNWLLQHLSIISASECPQTALSSW